jgi:succinylglutamate desuccinylase
MESRIIGRYVGSTGGPLFICIGGMHGNEPTGVEAIKEVFHLLKIEPDSNPDFQYKGVFIGIRGNLAALETRQRFISRDLNRMLTPEDLIRIRKINPEMLANEDRECLELIETINEEITKYNPWLTLILDMHTTTADGGIFTIAAGDDMSRTLAKGLNAPVVLGIAEGLIGTTIDFFNRPALNSYCIVFEAGNHDDPTGVHRSVAAIVNCMRSIGAVDPKEVDHRHDGLLNSISFGLPKISRLIFHYRIQPGEQFKMNPGYQNFQPVTKGEGLAKNDLGPVTAPVNGLILMPKYQSQGDDGFFIVEVVEP